VSLWGKKQHDLKGTNSFVRPFKPVSHKQACHGQGKAPPTGVFLHFASPSFFWFFDPKFGVLMMLKGSERNQSLCS
jgi:hypothetical protein